MSIITLSYLHWTFTCDLQGGRITKLSYKGVPILGSFKRIDGKQGSTHLCVPNFAAEGMDTYGLPFHGPARNLNWTPEKQTERQLEISVVLPQTKTYKAELKITQRFKLGKTGFTHLVQVRHMKGVPVPVNIAVHNYWATPLGWDNIRINHQLVSEQVKKNGFIKLSSRNLIEIKGKKIKWEIKGFAEAVLWSAFQGESYDSHYVCIEPVQNLERSVFRKGKHNFKQFQVKKYSQSIIPFFTPTDSTP